MLNPALFSSRKHDWETPQGLYDKLNDEFHFVCDVAASRSNTKHPTYFDKKIDGLKQSWFGVCWCNPPYGRNIGEWIKKAHNEAARGVLTVMLLPVRTDTKYFHDYIYGQHEIRFLRGRLKFVGAENHAPFPSMIVVFRPSKAKPRQ
jgi:phage N-6-adenine-methyltransferase